MSCIPEAAIIISGGALVALVFIAIGVALVAALIVNALVRR